MCSVPDVPGVAPGPAGTAYPTGVPGTGDIWVTQGGGDTSSHQLCGISVPVGGLGLQPPNSLAPPPSRYTAVEGK